MSTVSTSVASEPVPGDDDPFRYGWRDILSTKADGTTFWDQIPLTLEDVLFPQTGDFIVQSAPHNIDVNYLQDVFKSRIAGKPRWVVISDCRVDWNLPGIKPLGPDIAVFSGVREYKCWATLDIAAEGAKPKLVVEVTSPATRQNDVGIKVDFYFRARVPVYVIADAVAEADQDRRLTLSGYRYTRGGYRPMVANDRGWLWLEAVGLWLGVTRDEASGYDRLACYDAESGAEIGDYTAVTRALDEEIEAREKAERLAADERARAERHAAARENAEARIRELETLLKQFEQES